MGVWMMMLMMKMMMMKVMKRRGRNGTPVGMGVGAGSRSEVDMSLVKGGLFVVSLIIGEMGVAIVVGFAHPNFVSFEVG